MGRISYPHQTHGKQSASVEHIVKLSNTLFSKFYKDIGCDATKQIMRQWASDNTVGI